jgi:hypothetical protein
MTCMTNHATDKKSGKKMEKKFLGRKNMIRSMAYL